MDSKPRLLVVDDDRELAQMLVEYLERESFAVDTAADGGEALTTIAASAPDLIILDVMLPGANGFEILKTLRGRSKRVPVLMLTARGDDVDRILGLELGADDYLAKPFNPRELAARVRAILRRAVHAPPGATDPLRAGPVTLDPARMSVAVSGRSVDLTGAEFRVLECLLREAGTIVSRERLTEQALGRPLELYDRSIDTHVSNLRRKLALPANRAEIRAIRGAGYILTTEHNDTTAA
ncbi:MAG: response regulator transcription factor [Pseudomonadales bacterium]|nr:response regulator transcription factor [Pseudomonadales bacterium]